MDLGVGGWFTILLSLTTFFILLDFVCVRLRAPARHGLPQRLFAARIPAAE